jgi:hypothetical protein
MSNITSKFGEALHLVLDLNYSVDDVEQTDSGQLIIWLKKIGELIDIETYCIEPVDPEYHNFQLFWLLNF